MATPDYLQTKPFVELPTGELFVLYPDDELGTLPVDTSNPLLRGYAPFVIYAEPPNIIQPLSKEDPILSNEKILKGQPFSSPLKNRIYLKNNPNSLYGATISSIAGPPTSSRTEADENFSLPSSLNDRLVALDILDQYKQLKDLPPITLLINPQSMTLSYTKIQAYQDQTRMGYIFQAWGEDIPTMQISCKIGPYLSVNRDPRKSRGLHHTSRRDSAPYRQLMNLLALFKNGATIRDRLGRSEMIHQVGYHVIEYDGVRYTGHIKSFNWGVSSEQPTGGLDFDMDFEILQTEYFETTDITNIFDTDDINSYYSSVSALQYITSGSGFNELIKKGVS
jgi:hypothetical protein